MPSLQTRESLSVLGYGTLKYKVSAERTKAIDDKLEEICEDTTSKEYWTEKTNIFYMYTLGGVYGMHTHKSGFKKWPN